MSTLAALAPAVAKVVAFLGGIGAWTWITLVVVDSVVGLVVRSGNGGVFSWTYVKHFLVTNFATKEALVMLGLAGSAGASAVGAVLTGATPGFHAMFLTFVSASGAAFSAGVVGQDLALLRDIVAKFSGQTEGQKLRASLHKAKATFPALEKRIHDRESE